MIESFKHAPGADLDYGFDWQSNGWLAPGETIVASSWHAQGLGISRDQTSNGITSAFITGGRKGNSYRLTNTITTNQGRTDSRTILINVVDR